MAWKVSSSERLRCDIQNKHRIGSGDFGQRALLNLFKAGQKQRPFADIAPQCKGLKARRSAVSSRCSNKVNSNNDEGVCTGVEGATAFAAGRGIIITGT